MAYFITVYGAEYGMIILAADRCRTNNKAEQGKDEKNSFHVKPFDLSFML